MEAQRWEHSLLALGIHNAAGRNREREAARCSAAWREAFPAGSAAEEEALLMASSLWAERHHPNPDPNLDPGTNADAHGEAKGLGCGVVA